MGTPQRWLQLVTVVAVVVGLGGFASTAVAQDDPEDYGDTVHVVQPKPVLQQGRINVTPQLGMTINDPLYRGFSVGGRADFYLTERIHLGGLLQWHDIGGLIGGETQTYSDVIGETGASVDAPYLNWAAGAEVGFSPLFGKFSLFNRGIIFYTVNVTVGGVWSDSSSVRTPGGESGPGGTVSLGTQFFLNDWMAVDLEVRDVIYPNRNQINHSVTLGAGISLIFPRNFEYDEAQTL